MGQVIYDSGKRLERLIENFLIYAQIEMISADPQKIKALRAKRTERPAALIEQHARGQATLAKRPEDLTLQLAEESVMMSEDYLAKIVDELVQNAFKFSERGKSVTVSLSRSSDGVSLAVKDQGRGFTADDASRVGAYMQFDRKLHEQQGLGLGLVIAKRLTELHGGTLSIESSRGAATVVMVTFPG